MRPYLAILKCRFSALFQYRAAALAGLATQVFWGVIKVMIIQAFYAQSTRPQPITLAQTITFIWIGQALLQLLPWNADKDVEAQVKNGNVAYELVRPLDLYWLWFFRAMAMRIVPTLLRCIPLFIIAGMFFGLQAPASLLSTLAFGFSLILAVFLSSAITTLVIISLFWTISGEGIQRLIPHTVVLLSGMVVPLPLFPDWMKPFLDIQPFRGIIDIPSRLYTGVIPEDQALFYLTFQAVWVLAIILFGRWLLGKGIKQIAIQGG